MNDPLSFPIAAQVETLERRLANAEAKLARLLSFSNQLATCAYNLKQQERLTEHDKKCLEARGYDLTTLRFSIRRKAQP